MKPDCCDNCCIGIKKCLKSISQGICDLLKYIDIFGYPTLSFDKISHKTLWGGFISLILYMAMIVIFTLHIIGFQSSDS